MNPAAKWLFDLYKGSGLTKQKFAKRCGMCAIQISRWEHGEQDPYPVSIRKAGAAFGVEPPEEIIEAARKAQPVEAGALKKRRKFQSQNRRE